MGPIALVVAGERLGLEPSALGTMLENVGDADCGGDLLDPTLHQLQVGVVAQAEGVQPLSLGPGDVTGRGRALRVSVCVVPDERLPVCVTRPFDRVSICPRVSAIVFDLHFMRLEQADCRQRWPPSSPQRMSAATFPT
jgi:hypothetical protein